MKVIKATMHPCPGYKIIKKHYFLSILLLMPPVHELGHVIICWLTGVQIKHIDWFKHVIPEGPTHHIYLHHLWEYSFLIPAIILAIWGYFNLKQYFRVSDKNENVSNI